MIIKDRPLTLDEIKKIVYYTPGFFTCSSEVCQQSIASPEILKEIVFGKPDESSFIEVNGLNFAYTKAGTGENIVLLHGMRDNKDILKPLAEILSKNYCVISIDFRGHGYSEKKEGEYSTSQFADDVLAITEKLSLDRFIIFGHSLGAAVALEIGFKAPEKVSNLILAGTAVRENPGEYRPTNPEKMLKDPAMVDNFINMLNQKFFKHNKPESEKNTLLYIREKTMLSWMMLNPEIAKSLLNLKRTPLESEIGKIKIPVLIMAGENDIVGKIAEAEYIRSLIPGSHLTIIENAGHYMFLEYPEQAAKNIEWFLQGKFHLLHGRINSKSGLNVQSQTNKKIYKNVDEIGKDLNRVYCVLLENEKVIEIIKKIGDLSIHFEFLDFNEWASLYIKDNKLNFEKGRIGKATVIEHLNSDLFIQIMLGELNAPSAAMAGKFKVEGDLYKLMEFQPILSYIIKEYQKLF